MSNCSTRHRGYYMTTCGYEFYLWVFNSISHEWAQWMSEISSRTREDKIHIHKRACNILFIIKTPDKLLWKRRNLLCNYNDGDLFTCEDNMLSSRVKIWSFRGKAHLLFHWCLYNKASFLWSKIPQTKYWMWFSIQNDTNLTIIIIYTFSNMLRQRVYLETKQKPKVYNHASWYSSVTDAIHPFSVVSVVELRSHLWLVKYTYKPSRQTCI